MIVHIVLLKLKPGLSRNDKRVQDAFTELAGVGAQVPGVKRWECGWNAAQHPAAYDVALLSEFRSQADLDAYGPHSAHLRIAEKLKDITDFVFCDYEVNT
jgi:hypothetical protein